MKKHLFTLLFAVFCAVSLFAVPAHRQWRTVTQADGSVIEVMTVGDEFYHYTVNREGQQVRETNGVYQVVGEAPTEEVAKARRAKAMKRRQRKDIGTTPNLQQKGIVILANFSDQSMQSGHTQATFDELYNSTNCTVNGGYPSAAQYFADQSNGAYRPQFDVYGPVNLSRTVAYYGKNDASLDADQYPTDAVVEACILANQQYSINWADYDSDNDGYLDFVYVIYAGMGESDGGASTTIWPHSWQVSLARTSGNCTYTAADCKVGGKVIEYYAMSSELSSSGLCGIGAFCHEFGHIMGLPYLHDTNYGTNYTKCLTPNDWNIMDDGAYNGEGHCPPNYDPWQKDFFGWHTPVNLGSEPQNITLYANGTENYQAYQISASGSYVGPTESGVRYYIENRQATGWDAPLTGHGMLVWQVNYDATKWANNEVNTTANNPYYTIISASGTIIGKDFSGGNYCPMNTFPGTKNVTTCTPISGRELTEITETSNIITCKFNGGTSDSNEVKWYVVGWINGADVGEADYNTFDDRFLFQDGKLTLSCALSSYIAIKDQNINFYYSRTATTVADTVVTLDWANGWTGAQKWAIPEGTNYLIIREASPQGSITLERVDKATYDAYPLTPIDTIPDTPIDTFFKITVQADNTENGSVRGGGEYKKGETAVIMATPRMDCTFAAWSDGNTLNPRSIVVTGDSAFTAIFRRNVPLPVVVCSDTMYFTSADTTLLATRVYAPYEIEDYDKIIIATVNNKNVMGFQFVEDAETRNFRAAVEYTKNMNIANVSVVEVVPNGGNYRLRVTDGELAPRCEDCTSATNQLYATQIGADWYFAQYENSVLPEAAAYANRMILYNEEAPRFSSYRQVTGLDRSQTTVFKLHTPRNIPQTPEEIPVDTVSMVEEEKPMEDIPVSIEPQDTVAVISTPYVEYVHTFTLIVWADEAQTQVLVMITYDAQGNQLSITRPSAVRRIPTAGTEISFEVNDLKPNQVYHYTLVACEDDGSILTSLNSSFETATTASGVQNVSGDPAQPLKILLDGQILILRAGTIYTLTGQELK